MSCGYNPVEAFKAVDEGYTPSLRGGAGFPSPIAIAKTLIVSHDIGRFEIESSWTAFHDITKRILRLDGVFRYWVYATPVKCLAWKRKIKPPPNHLFIWSNADDGELNADIFDKRFLSRTASYWRWMIHISRDKETYREWKINLQFAHVIELELEGVGTAYWYTPINYKEGLGTNQLQETFRNAIECLLENHQDYVVDWEFEEESPSSGELTAEKPVAGRLILAAEAPSKELWDAAMTKLLRRNQAMKETKNSPNATNDDAICQELIKIRLTVVSHDQKQVRIIIPGERKITTYQAPVDVNICRTIRRAVHDRAVEKPKARVWNGLQNYYARSQTSILHLTLEANDNEEDEEAFKMGAFDLGISAIVVRPHFDQFTIFDASRVGISNQQNSAVWNTKFKTVTSFRRAIKILWPDYDEDTEEVCINQAKSNDAFVIGPDMQDYQWRLQVYDWFDSPKLYVIRRPRYNLRK
jgi:hypothetical protein